MKDDTAVYIYKPEASIQPLQNSENLQNRTTGRNGNMTLFYPYRKYN